MKEIDFMSILHKSTQRDYLSRVNSIEYPKAKAAKLAKKFDYEYWDGDRQICYATTASTSNEYELSLIHI